MTISQRNDLSLRCIVSTPSGAADTVALPLVVVIHGRGADANDLADLAPYLDNGYRFVLPNAPRPFEIYPGMTAGFTWFDGWPPAPGSIDTSRRLLLTLIDELVANYPTPDGKIVISGFSQGGMMSLDVGFRTERAIAGIVVMSGALYEDEMPDLRAKNDRPVILAHGTADEVIPINAARRTRRVLEDHGIELEYHEFPMGHQVSEEELQAVGAFLERVLSSGE
ncbi:MAG: phospholipase/carboxylesterase [Acidobacteriota bacterium]|jgi:phospholipase/carboxylesterase|nr:phospholipase/carboxylesterase [Acidobacteriota bacterium]